MTLKVPTLTQDRINTQIATKKIGLVGTFDVANYGDCLFPYVYMHLLRERMTGLEFSFYSPLAQSAGIMDYGPIRPLPAVLSDIQFTEDALILCGGETVWLGHSAGTFNFPASTLSAYARLWLAPTVAASRRGVDFYAHSVGMPYVQLEAPEQIGEALSCATAVSVRDTITTSRLGDRFPVEVDPVFALSTLKESSDWELEARQWLPPGYEVGRYLVAHISAPYLSKDLGQWCEQVASTMQQIDMPVLLLPICHFMEDRETLTIALELFIKQGVGEADVRVAPDASKDIIATAALLGMSGGVITSSLHACVTAVSFGVPFAGFVGAGKAEGKHRQTLLAAGVDFGMSMTIPQIHETFMESLAKDRSNRRKVAIAKALEAFDVLAKSLEKRRGSAGSLSDDTIKVLLHIDREPSRDLAVELKRSLLRWLRKSDLLGNVLNARQRARIRRSIL